jgi:hypothetical protein
METYGWELKSFVARNRLGLFKDLVGDILRSRSSIGNVVFDAKVSIRPPRVVTCCEEDTASSFIFPDDVRSGGSREDTVFSDDELPDAIGRPDPQNDLNGLGAKETSVSSNDQGRSFGIDRAEDRLDKILRIVLLIPLINTRSEIPST